MKFRWKEENLMMKKKNYRLKLINLDLRKKMKNCKKKSFMREQHGWVNKV